MVAVVCKLLAIIAFDYWCVDWAICAVVSESTSYCKKAANLVAL